MEMGDINIAAKIVQNYFNINALEILNFIKDNLNKENFMDLGQ